jgi:hypothetical protein
MRRLLIISIALLGILWVAGIVLADFYVIPAGCRAGGTKLSSLFALSGQLYIAISPSGV